MTNSHEAENPRALFILGTTKEDERWQAIVTTQEPFKGTFFEVSAESKEALASAEGLLGLDDDPAATPIRGEGPSYAPGARLYAPGAGMSEERWSRIFGSQDN